MARYYTHKANIGSAGTEPGQFNFPVSTAGYNYTGIAVDASYIYVVDSGNNRIQKFNKTTYAYVSSFGYYGEDYGQFSGLCGIVVDANYIYTLEQGNSRVQKFNKNTYAYVHSHDLLPYFGLGVLTKWSSLTTDGTDFYALCTVTDSEGTALESRVLTIASDFSGISGTLGTAASYMSDIAYSTASKWYTTNNGVGGDLVKPRQYNNVFTYITDFANLVSTVGIDNDTTTLYVTETAANKVRTFTESTLAALDWFGDTGTGNGYFQGIGKLAVDGSTAYVIDVGNNRVQVISWVEIPNTNPPTSLNLACQSPDEIVLNWTYTASTEASFEVHRSTNGASYVFDSYVPANTYTYTAGNILSGVLYGFKVRAILGDIPQSGGSGATAFSTAATTTCYYPPENFTAACTTNDRIYLSWTDSGAAVTSYEIYKSTDGITYALAATIGTGIYEAFISSIVQGQPYWFKIRSYYGGANYSAFTTPIEITCSFGGSETQLAEIYYITLRDGTILKYTSHDVNITWDGNTYTPLPIKRSNIKYHSNLEIDSVTLNIGIVGVTVGGASYTIPQIINRGFFRKATVEIYLVDWPTPTTSIFLFKGFTTGTFSYNQGILTLECNGELDKLNALFPKILYTELCQHEHFRSGTFACNLSNVSYKVSGVVSSTNGTYVIGSSSFLFSAHAEGYWLQGEVVWTSGDNTGISSSIKAHIDGFISVRAALPSTIQVGDGFDVYPGCDRTGTTCETKFNNYTNFFGFEDIPRTASLYGG